MILYLLYLSNQVCIGVSLLKLPACLLHLIEYLLELCNFWNPRMFPSKQPLWIRVMCWMQLFSIDKSHVITGTSSAPSYSVGTGTITSPNFPYGYALNGETFTYMLQNLDPYGHVRLVFDDWDVAEKSQIQVDRSTNTSFNCMHACHYNLCISFGPNLGWK